MRPLASTDYARGHLSVLSVLTVVTDPGEAAWARQFYQQKSAPNTYYSLVIVSKETDRIVGAGTVFLERKFLRGLGTVGHIEDIAVDKNQQGKKLGLRIIQALTGISENSGAYKTILNCSTSNIRTSRVLLLCYGKWWTNGVRGSSILPKVRICAEGERDGAFSYTPSACQRGSNSFLLQAKYAPERPTTPAHL
jgi:GNAT superfamily N-acetyltransferase